MTFEPRIGGRGRLLGGLVLLLALGAFVAVAYGRDATPPASPGAVSLAPVPASKSSPGRPQLTGSPRRGPQRLSDVDGVSRYAPILRRVAVRARPSMSAPVVTHLDTRTPEGSSNVVLLLERLDLNGRLWLHVRLPILPNNSTGWLARSAVGGYTVVRTHLVVDRGRLRATLYRAGRAVFSVPVGIGKAGTPTPGGQFYIRNELTKYANAFYGPVAFGTSARSAVLTDWPAGGFIGIHGTNEPALIPGRISHGCVRMRNADILRLARLMPPGTPLTIR